MSAPESYHQTPRLPPGTLRELNQRSDGPGLLRLGVQLALFWSGVAGVLLLPHPWHLASLPPLALVMMSFFGPLHECLHRSCFRTPWLVDLTAAWCGFMMFNGPTGYRDFHRDHHRFTNDPERDPEINLAPQLMSRWPSPLGWPLLASGLMLSLGKPLLSLALAMPLPDSAWDKVAPYLRPENRRRTAWENRALWAAHLALLAAGWWLAPRIFLLYAAWFAGHGPLALYLAAEHHGLPWKGSILERTRTTRSNGLLRWFMWNMPYHAEHHAWPTVPFHRLPELHHRVQDELPALETGYVALHLKVLSGRAD